MGNCMLKVEEKDTKCSSIFGSCSSGSCSSSCMRKSKQIEDVIDEKLKEYVNDHLHDILEQRFGKHIGDLVQQGLIKIIDIDLVPKQKDTLVVNEEKVEEGKTG
jgi:hypothetical protein